MNNNVKNRIINEFKINNNVIKLINIEDNYINFSYKNNHIKVEINNNYPNQPPVNMTINQSSITKCITNSILDKKYKITNNIFRKYKISCFFCNSLFCNVIWNSNYTIINVIQEYLNNNNKLKNIYNFSLCKKHFIRRNPPIIPEDVCYYILKFI